MAYQQPALLYAENALEPFISAKTLGFHYGKHHVAYITNYNNLVAGTHLDGLSLEEVIALTATDPQKVGIFNNGAQAWNHSFYWSCLTPNGGGKPGEELEAKLRRILAVSTNLKRNSRPPLQPSLAVDGHGLCLKERH